MLIAVLFFSQTGVHAQSATYNKGKLDPFRACYDVTYYRLYIAPSHTLKAIAGTVTMQFNLRDSADSIRIDVPKAFKVNSIAIDSLTVAGRSFQTSSYILISTKDLTLGMHTLEISYITTPPEAKNAPWDGGIVYRRDKKGNPWLAVACQGEGASLWWPCKDHPSDEPDSVDIIVKTPSNLVGVSNGRLRKEVDLSRTLKEYHWHVSYPINLYNITFNIGDYKKVTDTFRSRSGTLDLTYYVLRENEKKGKEFFKPQTAKMLRAFEHYFGAYPFARDGFKLVDAPFWGMEHQSNVAYGNAYQMNPFGFDFILVHESGHEWWGNHASIADNADMWIHEGFTTYAEALYVEYYQGKDKAQEYLRNNKKQITNAMPMLGPYEVDHHFDDNDVYNKGAVVLNSLRLMLNNDEQWFKMLRDLQSRFSMRTLNWVELERSMTNFCPGLNMDYLRYALTSTKPPVVKFTYTKRSWGRYRLSAQLVAPSAEGMTMPIVLTIKGKKVPVVLTKEPQDIPIRRADPTEISSNLVDIWADVQVVLP